MIDISSLIQALAMLDEALAARAAARADKFIRDACIQRFEYSYELTHKMLRRYLESSEPTKIHQLSFPNLIAWDMSADCWRKAGMFGQNSAMPAMPPATPMTKPRQVKSWKKSLNSLSPRILWSLGSRPRRK